MEPNTELKSFVDKINQEIAAEIESQLNNLETFIANSSFNTEQIESLRKFTSDEKTTLNSRIKFLIDRHEQQIADYEKIKIEMNSKRKIAWKLNQSLETLLHSELHLFKRNIAGFILMLIA